MLKGVPLLRDCVFGKSVRFLQKDPFTASGTQPGRFKNE